ncbi:MAG: 2-amino-4-hydroxy-6-hydroxymethyldihydropteridine diphosphokinase, partial [Chitinophagaceae bacterium]
MSINNPLHTIYLSGGSNLGNRLEYLKEAENAISKRIGEVLQKSSIYITSSWANQDEPVYLNIIWVVHTILLAENVLEEILEIEKLLGRLRIQKWAPRTIDIDILFYDNQIINLSH